MKKLILLIVIILYAVSISAYTAPDNVEIELVLDTSYTAPDSLNVELVLADVTPPVTDTCTYTSGDWNVDCSDNCVITTDSYLVANTLNLYGTGTFTVLANIHAGEYLQDLNCEVNDKSGDGKTIWVKL